MNISSACFLLFFAVLPVTAAGADKAHNIFDDDWTPPKTLTTPRPVAPAAVNRPDTKIGQTATQKNPESAGPTTVPPAVRRSIPGTPEQAAVRKIMKDVFAQQLKDRTIPARRMLTKSLLEQADKSGDAPVDQFVLLAAALDAAVDARDLPLAFKAADRMAKSFDVDALELKAEATIEVGSKADAVEFAAQNTRAALRLSQQLVDVEDFVTAIRVCTAIQPATARNAALRTQVQQRQRDITIARDAAGKAARDLEKLTKSPDDPALNLAVGRYFCILKGDWEGALPMLAKGSDAAMKELAVRELAHPTTGDGIADLGDGWWTAAARLTEAGGRLQMTRHALSFYERALEKTTGLRKVQITKRIEAATVLISELNHSPKPVELLSRMEGKTSGVDQGVVILKDGDRISTPAMYTPPVAFKIVAQTNSTNIRLSYGADEIIFNWEHTAGQLYIEGGPANGKNKDGAGTVPVNTWVTIDLVVKPDLMTISVDGRERHRIEADFSKVHQQLAIFQHAGSTVMVKSVQMTTPDE